MKFEERHVRRLVDIIVLLIIKDMPLHGYGIIAEIHKRFSVLISPGSLYPLLHTMEEDGLLQSTVDRSARRRRVYEITEAGEALLAHILKILSLGFPPEKAIILDEHQKLEV